MRVSGKGAVQACATSFAGAIVEFVGTIGADGAWVKEYLRRRGVGVGYLEQVMDVSRVFRYLSLGSSFSSVNSVPLGELSSR